MIRNVVSFVLLVLATVAITPATYWHDCLADHGKIVNSHTDGKEVVGKVSVKCHCDEQVVNTSFTNVYPAIQIIAPAAFAVVVVPPYSFLYYNLPATNDLRGPPARV